MKINYIVFLLFLSNIFLIKNAYSSEGNWKLINLENGNTLIPFAMTSDSNNNIYVGNTQSFYKITNDKAHDLTRPLPGLNPFNIKRLTLPNKNVIWGASEAGFFQYFIKKDSMAITNRKKMTGGDFDYTFLLNIVFDGNENLWFVSRNPYLSIFTGNEFIDHDLYWQNDIINTGFSSIPLESDLKNHSVWLGGTDGILKVNTQGSLNVFDYQIFSFGDCFISSGTTAFMFDDLDRTWITSSNGEISYYKNNEWTSFEIPDSLVDKWINPNDKKPNFIKKFGKDHYGNLYFFWEYSDFFLKLTPDLKLEKILLPIKYIDHSVWIHANPYTDMEGNIWISTGKGLLKYTPPKSTSVNEYKTQSLIPDIYIRKLYPNPASNKITAELMIFPKDIHKVKIEVYNYLGMKVKDLTDLPNINLNTADAILEFDVSDLENGIYYFAMSKGGEKRVQPFVKFE